MNRKLITLITLINLCGFYAHSQIVTFSGLGRAVVDNTQFKDIDSSKIGKNTRGYTLFDLGINAQPNDEFKASVVLRLRNEFGGFFGNGAAFEFRQMRLEGILGKVVKYEIGDIDVGLTKYTVYNSDEIYRDYESDIFKTRRDIVNYENFYNENKWRLQGLNAASAFNFTKGIEKLTLRTFGARTRQSNYFTSPDRFLYGAKVGVVQSKYFEIGLNYTGFSDIASTTLQNQNKYSNHVFTTDFKVNVDLEKVTFGLNGEVGMSAYKVQYNEKDSVKRDDNFFDVTAFAKIKDLNLKIFAGYKRVGYYFLSPGAQTQRIYDIGTPDLFPNYLGTVNPRDQLLFDRFTQEYGGLNNRSIVPYLQRYNVVYNNVNPYGAASPNRVGFNFGAAYEDKKGIIKSDAKFESLGELVNDGNNQTEKRKYTVLTGGARFNINKLAGWEKSLALTGGVKRETTKRSGANEIDLKSLLIDAGLEAEVYKKFFLLAGYKSFNVKGNEVYLQRDAFNNETNGGLDLLIVEQQQSIVSGGLKYNFNQTNVFNVQVLHTKLKDKLDSKRDLGLTQIYFVYTLKF